MSEQRDIVAGELFARQYIERSAPLQDSQFFRQRLDAYLQATHYNDRFHLASYLRQESGLVVQHGLFTEFFTEARIEHILSAITLIWRFLRKAHPTWGRTTAGSPVQIYPAANDWHAFAARAMREENMAYTLDEKCGVHFFVDEQFERNRVTALASLAGPRYAGARDAFERSHAYLDAQPSDTKAAVRSAFEALEILARLIDPESRNLNRWMVENKLKPLALARASNVIEAAALEKLFAGLAQFVDAMHLYRHGQGVEEPIAPTLALAVYAVSSVASALRLLASVDAAYPLGG